MTDFEVNNEDLYNELKEYIETLKIDPEHSMSNKLGVMISRIVEGLSMRWNFRNYQYRDEMVSLGIYYTVKYIKKYDLSKKNPHAYISRIAENAFKAVINKEKKHLYTKYKLQMMNGSVINSEQSDGNVDIQTGNVGDYHHINTFIESFETSMKEKEVKNIISQKNLKNSLDI